MSPPAPSPPPDGGRGNCSHGWMQTTALLFPILQNWQNRLGWSLGTHKQRVPSPEKPRGGCPGLSGSAVLPGRWHHGKSHHVHYPLSHTRGSQQGHSWPGAHSSLRLALPCPCRADGQTEVWGKGCAGMCMNVTGGWGVGRGSARLSRSAPSCSLVLRVCIPHRGDIRCTQPRVSSGMQISARPPLGALSPVLLSPSECLLSSTSCLILSFGTFRYLSQLHTWEKRGGR